MSAELDTLADNLDQLVGDFADVSLDAQLRALLAANSVMPLPVSAATAGARSMDAASSQPTSVANDPQAQSGFATLMDESITADQISAHSILISALAAGASGNQIDNPGFEMDNAVVALGSKILGWTASGVPANIGTTSTVKRSGAYAARLITDAVTNMNLVGGNIPVDPGKKYRVSGFVAGKAGNNAGSIARLRVRWMAADGVTSLASVTTDVVVGAGTAFVVNTADLVADANAVYAEVGCIFPTAGTTAANEIYFDDIEFYRLDNDVNQAAGQVFIDSRGITVLNGVINISDLSGSSVLNASGFAGSWLDFLRTGYMYNGLFRYGPSVAPAVSEVGTAATDADYAASLSSIYYWIVAAKAATGGSTTVGDTAFIAGTCLKMIATTATQVNRVYQDVPIAPQGRVAFYFKFRNLQAVSSTIKVYASYRDATHGIIGTRQQEFSLAPALVQTTTEKIYLNAIGAAPANAVYVRVELEVTHGASTELHFGSCFVVMAEQRIRTIDPPYIDGESFSLLDLGPALGDVRVFGELNVDQYDIGRQIQWGSTPHTKLNASNAGLLNLNLGSLALTTHIEAALAADVNNYEPGNGKSFFQWRLAPTAARIITGIAAIINVGRIHVIINWSAFTLTLAHQSASSTATNQFVCKGSVNRVLAANESCMIVYNTVSQRWHVLN